MRYIKIRRFGREISPRPHFLVGYDSAFEPGPMPTQLLRPRVRGPRHALNVLQRHTLLKPLVVNTCELPILLALAHQAHTKVREAKTPGRSGCRGRRRGCGCGRPRGRPPDEDKQQSAGSTGSIGEEESGGSDSYGEDPEVKLLAAMRRA